jgi:hypothetical protein
MIKTVLIMTVLVLGAIVVLPLTASFNVHAATAQPKLLPLSLYKTLSAKWWQYLLSVPPSTNPILDDNPCDAKQKGAFFYLVGTFGGSAERTCTVPKGKSIFFPVVNVFATLDKNDPAFDTIAKVKKFVTDNINQASDLQASVDGVNINLDNARAQSQQFPLKVPKDNILGGPEIAGTYLAIADGYWVGLKALSVGEHTIHFAGKVGTFSVEVTYHIIVQ